MTDPTEAPVPLPPFVDVPQGSAFRRFHVQGSLVYLSGHIPPVPEGGFPPGRLGDPVTVDEGRAAARAGCAALLASLREAAGGLDQVEAVVKVLGFVAAAPGFTGHSSVVDGASELLTEALGPDVGGAHARSAIGVASLPLGAPVEIEAVVRLRAGG